MSKSYVIFDAEGFITRSVFCPESQANLQVGEGEGILNVGNEPVSDETHYVRGGAAAEKVSLDTSHVVEGLLIRFYELPVGLSVRVLGEKVITDESPTEIEFDLPGTYVFEMYGKVQYLDKTLEVTVG